MTPEQARTAKRAAVVSIAATLSVVAVKLVAAKLSGSISVLAEGLQSIADVFMSILALTSLSYAARPADESHPYGHGKAELLSSAFQMIVILASGGYILAAAYQRWFAPQPIEWNWGVAAMAYSIVVNMLVARHLIRVSAKTDSFALKSESLHLKGDTLASFGVLLGVGAVGLTGILELDPATAAIFAVISMIQAFSYLRKVIHPLMDGALPNQEVKLLEAVLNSHPEVRGYHNLRTRSVGSVRFIDLHVMLDDQMSFVLAHDTAEQIEGDIRTALGGGVVSIHYEPFETELAHRAKEHNISP